MSRPATGEGSFLGGWFPLRLRLVLVLICAAALIPTSADAAGRDLAGLERAVDEIGALVLAADFQRAIARGKKTRPLGRDLPRSSEAMQARARLEVLICSAQIALGDRAEARRSIERAVYLWPLLSLDERTTSPRVLKLFRAVRASTEAARTAR